MHITEVSVDGKTWYISSHHDYEVDGDSLYYGYSKNSGQYSLPSNLVLRNGEIVDKWSLKSLSKFDLSEVIRKSL